MSVATVENIHVDPLSTEEQYALNILESLPVDKVDRLKRLMELNTPGVIGPTTLGKFLKLCSDCGINLSEAGVNAFSNYFWLKRTTSNYNKQVELVLPTSYF